MIGSIRSTTPSNSDTNAAYAYLKDQPAETVRLTLSRASLQAIEEIAPHLTKSQYLYCKLLLPIDKVEKLKAAWEKAYPANDTPIN